jgi:hypothetical protein
VIERHRGSGAVGKGFGASWPEARALRLSPDHHNLR